MRKQDLRLGTMYSFNDVAAFRAPAVLASLSEEFHISRGEVGRGSPTGRGLRTGFKHPVTYIAICRMHGVASLDEFDAWIEGGPIPAEHAQYLAVAQAAGEWLASLTDHHYAAIPQVLLPEGFQLAAVRSRDLSGEWIEIKRARRETEKAQRAARAARAEKVLREQSAFTGLVELMESFGLHASGMTIEDIKPHIDSRFHTQYSKVVLPVSGLSQLLTSLRDELERARDGTD